ncbi:hypothetical protein [Bacillus sp. JJ1122]|uniref:hypothetical protein n=1 Tax=Bacillus sp. JJ1122 TaxID=3122951 RepID=UPI003000BC5D
MLMNRFREEKINEMAAIGVTTVEDYSLSIKVNLKDNTENGIDLPKSNVLKYHLADGSWFCLRPSGTEPKAKFYFGVKAATLEESKDKLDSLKESVMNKVQEILS